MSGQYSDIDFEETEGPDEYTAEDQAVAEAALREELGREVDELFAPLREKLISQAVELRDYRAFFARRY